MRFKQSFHVLFLPLTSCSSFGRFQIMSCYVNASSIGCYSGLVDEARVTHYNTYAFS